MGGDSGGAAGKVAWADYLMTLHSKFLDKEGTVDLDYSVFDLLNNDAQANIYAGVSIYDGRTVTGSISYNLAELLQNVLSQDVDVYDSFQRGLRSVSTDFTKATDKLAQELEIKKDYHARVGKFEGDQVKLGAWASSSTPLSKSFLYSDLIKVLSEEFYKDVTNQVVAEATNIITNANELVNFEQDAVKLIVLGNSLAVEAVKFTILNEREYTNQNFVYLYEKGVWRISCYQSASNAIASLHGKTIVPIVPDKYKLHKTLADIAGYGVGDFIGPSVYRSNPKLYDSIMSYAIPIGGIASAIVSLFE